MRSLDRMLMAAAIALLGGTAFAQQKSQPKGTPPSLSAEKGVRSGSTADQASELATLHSAADTALMHAMKGAQKQMSQVKMTGNADRDFTSLMIQQDKDAINMAHAEQRYGISNRIKTMAGKILQSRSREIRQMVQWQKSHPE